MTLVVRAFTALLAFILASTAQAQYQLDHQILFRGYSLSLDNSPIALKVGGNGQVIGIVKSPLDGADRDRLAVLRYSPTGSVVKSDTFVGSFRDFTVDANGNAYVLWTTTAGTYLSVYTSSQSSTTFLGSAIRDGKLTATGSDIILATTLTSSAVSVQRRTSTLSLVWETNIPVRTSATPKSLICSSDTIRLLSTTDRYSNLDAIGVSNGQSLWRQSFTDTSTIESSNLSLNSNGDTLLVQGGMTDSRISRLSSSGQVLANTILPIRILRSVFAGETVFLYQVSNSLVDLRRFDGQTLNIVRAYPGESPIDLNVDPNGNVCAAVLDATTGYGNCRFDVFDHGGSFLWSASVNGEHYGDLLTPTLVPSGIEQFKCVLALYGSESGRDAAMYGVVSNSVSLGSLFSTGQRANGKMFIRPGSNGSHWFVGRTDAGAFVRLVSSDFIPGPKFRPFGSNSDGCDVNAVGSDGSGGLLLVGQQSPGFSTWVSRISSAGLLWAVDLGVSLSGSVVRRMPSYYLVVGKQSTNGLIVAKHIDEFGAILSSVTTPVAVDDGFCVTEDRKCYGIYYSGGKPRVVRVNLDNGAVETTILVAASAATSIAVSDDGERVAFSTYTYSTQKLGVECWNRELTSRFWRTEVIASNASGSLSARRDGGWMLCNPDRAWFFSPSGFFGYAVTGNMVFGRRPDGVDVMVRDADVFAMGDGPKPFGTSPLSYGGAGTISGCDAPTVDSLVTCRTRGDDFELSEFGFRHGSFELEPAGWYWMPDIISGGLAELQAVDGQVVWAVSSGETFNAGVYVVYPFSWLSQLRVQGRTEVERLGLAYRVEVVKAYNEKAFIGGWSASAGGQDWDIEITGPLGDDVVSGSIRILVTISPINDENPGQDGWGVLLDYWHVTAGH